MGPWGWVVQSISSKLAFFPPQPASYEVREHNDGTGQLYIEPTSKDIRRVRNCEVIRLQTPKRRGGGGGEEIIACYFSQRNAKCTLLHSHGNAVDLAQLLPFYKELSRELACNIMAYDYSGYGCSSGKPTVNNTYADIEACYACLQQQYGKKPSEIVLYGQSVGSGPTTWLAAKSMGLGGVVLHTPLLSGVRVLNPSMRCWPSFADIYPNINLIPKISAPICVLHGTADEVIDVSHGRTIHKLAKHPAPPLFPEGYNHQNLELCPQYIPHLRTFLNSVATLPSQPPPCL